ncbi:hemicentin-1-like [Ruditapes philippinarum]|uniref:hemicentin-1-like n=1 Tax=Ruditapes philippinarum TaxID=129788 RepID=UPI00295AA123|nr:hemicentin-1-like [Ruditapes philippinarum]
MDIRNGSKLCAKNVLWCFYLFMLVLSDIGVMTNTIQLTPTQLYAKENSSATLTCSRTDGKSILETIWKNSEISDYANLYYFNGQCVTTRFLKDSNLFDGLCNGDGTYSVILKKIDRTQHGAEWTCEELISISNKVVIQVLVPATSLTLSQPNWDFIKENTTGKVICRTSACRPEPRVHWYVRNSKTNFVYNLTQSSTKTYIDGDYGLKAVESILQFSPNRTINNLRLYCEVMTQANEADIKSSEFIVNVTYPPDNSPLIQGVETNEVLQVIETDTNTFVCSITGGNPLASLSWKCFDSLEITSISQGSTVLSTVKWVALRNFSTCSCTSHHTLSNWKRTTDVKINVQYPPDKPHFKIGQTSVFGDVRVILNNTLRVVCNSESNPLPYYTWTGPGFSGNGDTLEIAHVKIYYQGDYKCKASNRMTRTNASYKAGSQSSSLSLTILYPPSNPKFKFENSSGQLIQSNIFYGIRNDTFSIYCDVKGSPVPDIKWDDNKSNPTLSISNINLDINSTCRATNVMKETASQRDINSKSEASLSIIVLYPPSLPTIHVSNYNGDSVQVQNGNLSITETETINVTCFSNSKPLPSYKWINEKSFKTQSTNILKFVNISRHESGIYACSVANYMRRSIGGTEVGKSTLKIILNILYPAILNPIYDISITEGSPFEISCPVKYENPSNSTITWSKLSDENRWNNKQLSFKNVSREDGGNYTCIVITEMYPTIGSSSKIERRQSFHLNVFFPSEIHKFSISTETSGRTFVANRTQNLSFECIAKANPSSDLKIKSPRGDYIIEVSQSNIARYTLHNASFKDAGEYICTGRNKYTKDTPSQSKLILIVKSRPRPSSGDTSVTKVATVLNVNVTLSFQARNYLDEPNKTMFIWLKENVSISDNDNKYLIHTNDLQTNIIIRNTTQQDLGYYKVEVENSVGLYTHYYELRATTIINKIEETETTHSSNTGLLVGVGVGASIGTLAFVAVAFIGYKRFKNMRHSRHDSPKSGITVGVNATSNYTDLDTSRRDRNVYDEFNAPSTSTYERLNTSTREITTYMELKNTTVPNADTSDYVNIRI